MKARKIVIAVTAITSLGIVAATMVLKGIGYTEAVTIWTIKPGSTFNVF